MSSPSSCRRQQHRLQHQRSRTNEYASATNGNTNSHARDDMKQHPVAEKRFVQKQRRLGQNSNVFASVTSSSSSSSKTKGENKKQKSRTHASDGTTNTNNKKRAIPLSIWESRKGSNFKLQYELDGNKLRLLSPEEARDLSSNKNGAFSFDP